jgi:hypothetical protein
MNASSELTLKSLYPPVCVYGDYSKSWYIIADGVWHQVRRKYSWMELEKMWERRVSTKIEYPRKKINHEKKKWLVVGSKGNNYTVEVSGANWTCTCPSHGFGRGRDCKHITQIKSKNGQ